jgi:probable FeS assembly SUF system protein SufT
MLMWNPYAKAEPVTLRRACEAVMVPLGDTVNLPAGLDVAITQSLGGSFTVYVDGNLYRIAGKDADALGREPEPAPEIPVGATQEQIEALVWDQMKSCYDPEIPIDVVELGLIYDCSLKTVAEGRYEVDVVMTLTAPGCGMGGVLVADVKDKVEHIPVVDVARVELVFDPPWNASMMSEAARLQTGML